jgi:hypothetical protein
MDFTVELQPPMAFSLWWMAAVPVLLLLTTALLFFAWKKRNQKPEVAKEERTWELNPVTLAGIRVRYLEKLDQTENRLLDGSITVREAYREMSDIARGFASDISGREIGPLTLNEMRALHMEGLRELISEFYEPEFARRTRVDARASIRKTRKAIQTWH